MDILQTFPGQTSIIYKFFEVIYFCIFRAGARLSCTIGKTSYSTCTISPPKILETNVFLVRARTTSRRKTIRCQLYEYEMLFTALF